MHSILITFDRDLANIFGIAGIKAKLAISEADFKKKIIDSAEDSETGIVFIEEENNDFLDDFITSFEKKHSSPIIVKIPGKRK